MAALQDSLTNLGQFQIPRPKCVGMEFITIRGSHSGFYRSINKSVAIKYGIVQQKNGLMANKRPTIPENWIGQEKKTQNGPKGGIIPEEPEMEPTPDYEQQGEENGGKCSADDRIALPIVNAPPAPPLLPEFRQSLLKKRHHINKNGKENMGKSRFKMMATGGNKFMGKFGQIDGQNGIIENDERLASVKF